MVEIRPGEYVMDKGAAWPHVQETQGVSGERRAAAGLAASVLMAYSSAVPCSRDGVLRIEVNFREVHT